jgi:transposase
LRQKVRLVVSDGQWKRIEKLCVGKPEDPGGTGANNRMFVEAALWIARTGCPWRDLPAIFGKWNSVFVRFNRWSARRGMGADLCRLERRSRLRISDRRFDHRTGAPARGWRKRGTQNQAIGRSRGGLSSKIHLAVRGLGLPVRCLLTAGQRHDILKAAELIDGLPVAQVMGDTAYDADHFREKIAAIGAQAVIPSSPSRATKHPLDEALYKERHLVECCINKLKHFRRVATRYEKTARNFLAMITLAAIALWLR